MASKLRIGKKTYLMDDDWNPQPEADGPLHVGFFDSPALLTNAQRAEHDAERQARIDRQGIPQTRSRYRSYKKPSKTKTRVKVGGKRNVQPKGDANNNSGNKGGNNWFRNYFTNISNLGNTNVTNDFREKAKSILSTAKVGKRDKERMLNSLEKAATGQVTTTVPTDSIKAGNNSTIVPNDSIRVPRDTTVVSRDSVARDSITRDSLRIPRDTVPADTIKRDSLLNDSIPRDSVRTDSIQGRGNIPPIKSNFEKVLEKFYNFMGEEYLNRNKTTRRDLAGRSKYRNYKTTSAHNRAVYVLPGDTLITKTISDRAPSEPTLYIDKFSNYKPANRSPKRFNLDASRIGGSAVNVIPGDTISTPNNDYILDSNYTPKRINKSKPKYSLRKPANTSGIDSLLNSATRLDSVRTARKDSLESKKQYHYTPDEYTKLNRFKGESDAQYVNRVIKYGKSQGFTDEEMKIWLQKHNL